jgi:ubiquinone/menaquinone biosynthesis C-methylase UbiE
MKWYDEWVLPRVIDVVCGVEEMKPLREQTCAGLTGRVLEVGFGSGHNLELLPSSVTEVGAVDPSDTAWKLAQSRIESSPIKVLRAGTDAQRIDAPDFSYDSALVTFALCTIPDAPAALAEVRRVLKPGGQLHFVEHGEAPDAKIARWQQRLQPVWGRCAGGCHLGRPIADLVAEAGFTIDELETFYGAGPKFASYFYRGSASVG